MQNFHSNQPGDIVGETGAATFQMSSSSGASNASGVSKVPSHPTVPKSSGILKGNYKKRDITMEEDQPAEILGIHYIKKMSKLQFRACMGLLGLESNAFLSDRIFEVVDTDRDEHINFAQFTTIMDTLINGEEDEKHEFSFALLDVYNSGYLGFEEFKEIITKFIAHFCIITGS